MCKFLCAHKFQKLKRRNVSKFLNKCQPGPQSTKEKEGRSDDLPRKLSV